MSKQQPVIRPGTIEDAKNILPRLRFSDLLEIMLFMGEDYRQLFLEGVQASVEFQVAELHQQVIAVWGLNVEKDGRSGVPWALASPEVLAYPVGMVKMGRQMIARWEQHCNILYNYVHVANHVSIAWLKRFGFQMQQPVPMGPFKAEFMLFYRMSDPKYHGESATTNP